MKTDLREQLQTALGGAYSVERELGGGGMSRVFVAEERSLGRRVVVKVLPPELAAEVNVERFRREVQLAAQLQHPHIVPLLTAGEAGAGEASRGLLYYTMPLVEGESLRATLTRGGELPIPEALRILHDVLKALVYAHRRGVVHRDIKPENILVAEDAALVTDFGIAKAISAATGEMSVTSVGVALGTPAYMAPEQAAADPTTDHRADIYAVGVVAYELLTGRAPFSGLPPQQVLAAHATETPDPVTKRRASVPPALAALVMRCLEKRPADRPQSAGVVLQEVRMALAASTGGAGPTAVSPPETVATGRPAWRRAGIYAGLIILVVAAGYAVFSRASGTRPTANDAAMQNARSTTAPAAPASQSIAVLPFVNMSADKENEYFSDGMTEELINALSKLGGLRVASRTSAFQFKGKQSDVRTIGDTLNVATVLEGSVRKAGNRLKVTAQLVNVADGYHLWSETYERELKDVFAVQDEIARAIVSALRLRLEDRGGAPLVKRSTENLEAYNLYLRGRYFVNKFTAEGFRTGIELFERALAEDPTFAMAYSGLADAYMLMGSFGSLGREGAYAPGKAAALKALALDSTLAEAHTSLAFVRMVYEWDWQGGEQALRRALMLDPNHVNAHHWYGLYFAATGRLEDGLRENERALELDPLLIRGIAIRGRLLFFARQYDQAIAQLRRAIEMDPAYEQAYSILSFVYARQGKLGEAVEMAEKLAELRGDRAVGQLGYVYAIAGRRADALKLLGNLNDQSKQGRGRASDIALIHLGLGDRSEALALLEQGLEDHWVPIFLKVDPTYDPLRSDPRFTRILRKMRLE
ncbi:MAG: protein kinase [Gemmatimonadaceae bacterium]